MVNIMPFGLCLSPSTPHRRRPGCGDGGADAATLGAATSSPRAAGAIKSRKLAVSHPLAESSPYCSDLALRQYEMVDIKGVRFTNGYWLAGRPRAKPGLLPAAVGPFMGQRRLV